MSRTAEFSEPRNFNQLNQVVDQASNESLLTANGLSIITESGRNYIRDESTGLILTDPFQVCSIFNDSKDGKTISRIVSQIDGWKRDLIPPSDFFDVLGDDLDQENLIRKKLLISKLFPECEGNYSDFTQNYYRQRHSYPHLRSETFSPDQLRSVLAFIFNCDTEQISLYEIETARKDNIKFHYGDFHLVDLNQKQPEKIGGSMYFDGKTFDVLVLSDIVGGDVDFRYVESFRSLTLPKKVGSSVYLHKAKNFEKLIFSQRVNNMVYLDSLTPEEIYKLDKPDNVEIEMR